jgi:hypothetical protein
VSLVQQKVYFNVTLSDNGGNKSTLRFNTRKTDLADLATDIAEFTGAGGLLADLAAVTDANIVGYSAGVAFAEDSDLYAGAGVQIEDIGEIVGRIDGEPDKWTVLRIPAPVAGIFVGSEGPQANLIDPNDADLQAYLANFESGGLCYTSDGEDLADSGTAGNFSGKRIHRASRKG